MANLLERRLLSRPLNPLKLLRKRKRDKRDDEPKKDDEADKKDDDQGNKDGKEPAKNDDKEPDKEPDQKSDQDDDSQDRDDDSPGTIAGYAAVSYNDADPGTEYELWSDRSFRAVERVARDCFRAAIDRDEDVRGLYNHEADQLLGRTSSGTMRIEEDEKGLRYEIDLPDTQTGRDVAHLVDRGDLTGSSFGFVVEQESWRETEEEDGSRLAVRTIESVRLLDVGPVTYPAYSSTSAGRSAQSVRALGSVEEARDSYKRWKEKQREELPLAAKLAQVRARAVQVAG